MNKVLIIGSGIIGLSIARQLHKQGVRQITILERKNVGEEASFAAAGMLAVHAETDKKDDFLSFCQAGLSLYENFAEELLEETNIDIELDREGTIYLAFDESDVKEIRQRYEWQKEAGLQVEKLSAEEIRKVEPFVSPNVREGLFFPKDWQVENRKVLLALQKYCELNGIEIVENTEVTSLINENDKIIGVETSDKKFFADSVVLATGAWTSLIKAQDFELPKVKPIRGQMISFRTAKRLISKVIYSPRGYIVPRIDGRILVGATVEDVGFVNEMTQSGIESLHESGAEIIPSLMNLGILEKWSGLRPFGDSAMPIIGEFAENLFIATAHYRNGILLAPITAKIVAEKVCESEKAKISKTQS
jgi:glycine oxidase